MRASARLELMVSFLLASLRAKSGHRSRAPKGARPLLGALLLLGASAPLAARAASPPHAGSPPAPAAAPAPAPDKGAAEKRPLPPPSPKRQAPDYDGLPDPVPSAGERLLWAPRVLFFPVYLVTEYGIRWPLGALTTAAERGRWIQIITELFTFGPGGKMGTFPTALIDFGFRSSVGAYYFWDDAGAKGNAFRVHAAIGGFDWLRLTMGYRVQIDPTTHLRLRAEGWRRPDGAFWGIGPSAREQMLSRYLSDTLAGGVVLETRPSRSVFVSTSTQVRHLQFPKRECCDEPTLQDRIDAGQLPSPPGYEKGFTSVRQGIKVALDSRAPRPEPGSGARIELQGDLGFDAEHWETARWVSYGATAGGFLDLTGKNRVLSLSVTTMFADPLGEGEIPFLELPTLGGDGPMRGFLGGRLYGRSAAAAKLEYRYPVWAFVDGTLQFAMGNVYGEHLQGFRPELFRLSFAGGLRSVGERDQSLDILIGAGTETFEDGARVNNVRIIFGTTNGF